MKGNLSDTDRMRHYKFGAPLRCPAAPHKCRGHVLKHGLCIQKEGLRINSLLIFSCFRLTDLELVFVQVWVFDFHVLSVLLLLAWQALF